MVIVRERGGNSVPAVFKSEAKAMAFLRAHVAKGTIMNADEAGSWEELHKRYEVKRINHQEAYSLDGACTNWAEEFFSRMRRAEIGHHHHIAGPYLLRYAQEASWREDNRRAANGEQVNRLAGLAMAQKPSVDFSGYWQRHSPGRFSRPVSRLPVGFDNLRRRDRAYRSPLQIRPLRHPKSSAHLPWHDRYCWHPLCDAQSWSRPSSGPERPARGRVK